MAKQLKSNGNNSQVYARLLGDMQDILEAGRTAAKAAVAAQLVDTYWKLGARLADAPRKETTLTRLAKDLGVRRPLLHEVMAFYAQYPDGPPDVALGWTHHRRLLTVRDAGARKKYVNAAVKSRWTVDKLVNEIKNKRFGKQTAKEKAAARKVDRPTDPGYVYRADLVRVIDGDTAIMRVDLGFYVHVEQRMRLAVIDAPEDSTVEGNKAAAFLQKTLEQAGTIAIKSDRVDRYGRYVAHLFVGEEEDVEADAVFAGGVYVNDLMLRRGLVSKIAVGKRS